MKFGEALRLRSDNQKKIEELRKRAVTCAQAQEGSSVAEAPDEILAGIERLSQATLALIVRINRTNVVTRTPSGVPLVDALAEREHLLQLRAPFVAVADAASTIQSRFMRSEIRIVNTVDPSELRKRADDFARRHRVLDTQIQELNWVTELVE